MSSSNDSNWFGNKGVILFLILVVLSTYVGHAVGRGDKEDYLQQQKYEQKVKQIKWSEHNKLGKMNYPARLRAGYQN